MAVTTPQQEERIDGIVKYVNDFLDKRFNQARRISESAGRAEADLRVHQIALMRIILAREKGFGPIRVMVCDILCSTDEVKKAGLFNPVDQVCIMREIVPSDDEVAGKKTAGKLAIHNIKTYYSALDPSLEKILGLVQTWIWWDLLDAAELYRFDALEEYIESLKTMQLEKDFLEGYRKTMGMKPGIEVTRQAIIKYELTQAKELIDKYVARRARDDGYQIIIVSEEREGNPEADQACLRLAKRLTTIDKVRALKGNVEDSVRQYYAGQMGVAAAQVTGDGILRHEQHLAARERQTLAETLSSASKIGKTSEYKGLKLVDLRMRFDDICKSLGAGVQKKPAAAG